MRHKKSLLLTMAGASCFLLSSIGDEAQQQAAAAVPNCHCTNFGGSFAIDNTCGGSTPLCSSSSLNLVSDTLSCGIGTPQSGCAVSGSVTVNAYDSCTTAACAIEFHTNCNALCPAATAERFVASGGTATPQQNACCLGPAGCTYNFEVRFYIGPTSCPNQPNNAHCKWSHQFQCL